MLWVHEGWNFVPNALGFPQELEQAMLRFFVPVSLENTHGQAQGSLDAGCSSDVTPRRVLWRTMSSLLTFLMMSLELLALSCQGLGLVEQPPQRQLPELGGGMRHLGEPPSHRPCAWVWPCSVCEAGRGFSHYKPSTAC